jgi:hypothetical protein
MADPAIRSRRELLRRLAVAAELEHGLCLQYLFTAASLKDRFDEGGLTVDELIRVRGWKATLNFIASQEMLHLAQVINLTVAVGGQPHLTRPNFPQRPDYYPTGLPWGLWTFRAQVIELYAWYERPDNWGDQPPDWPDEDPLEAGRFPVLTADSPAAKDPFAHLPDRYARPRATPHETIVDLYAAIGQAYRDLPGMVIGDPADQLTGAMLDSPQLIEVVDVPTALAAIELIVEQGEGRPDDEPDSHVGAYLAILDDLSSIDRPGFAPARDVAANPLSRLHPDNTYPGWRLIDDPHTRAVNDLTSGVYRSILELLLLSGRRRPWAAPIALALMTGVLAPLTEILTTLPMGLPNDGDGSPGEQTRARCAGAGFELSPTPAPMPGPGAPRLVQDALLALAGDADRLATGDRRLDAVGASIRAAADRLGGTGSGSGSDTGVGSDTETDTDPDAGTDGADGAGDLLPSGG